MLTHNAMGWFVANAAGVSDAGPFATRQEAEKAYEASKRAIKRAKRKAQQVSVTLSIDTLCKLLGVTTLGDYADKLDCYNWEVYQHIHGEALAAGLSEEEADEKARQAEDVERDSACEAYRDAVVYAAERLFGEHGLMLTRVERKGQTWQWEVFPVVSWRDAANRILLTVNGVGMFEFASTREFLTSGPYTPKQAVMGHLHWIKRWPDVYGEPKPQAMIEWRMR